MTEETKTHSFQAEVAQVLSLVINSLYSHKEIFLRELISNAADALDKLRFAAIAKPALLKGDPDLEIRVIPDEEAGTITIWDNGIGMTRAELKKNLGTIAHSGSQAFLEKLKKNAKGPSDANLIGQFGVGFYSAFLVADRVEVISRAAGKAEAFKWTSEGADAFTIGPAERANRGTSITLHVGEDHKEYLAAGSLRGLIQRYSDYISHAIKLPASGDEGDAFETVNQASALWQRSPDDITDEQYDEFYKHLTHDWEPALGRTHFHIEGAQLFTGLLFVPKRPPFGLWDAEAKHGVRLHVKRVFIMDDCEDLLPRWLRFMRGVVDSDDLPLNVSREVLQDSRLVRAMRKQVVKKTLALLQQIATDQPDDYTALWGHYGPILKEGLHFEPPFKMELSELVRYETSRGEGLVSLAEYVARMPDDQEVIYYAQGTSRRQLDQSPHLEVLRKRGVEVLYMLDTADQWAVTGLGEYDGKSFVSALKAGLDLGDTDLKDDEGDDPRLKSLRKRMTEILDEHVSDVSVSSRLTDSPACLVIPEGGMPAHIEMLFRAQNQDMPKSKRLLEINPDHPLIVRLAVLAAQAADSPDVVKWVELLYDQAVLAEGMPLEDPARLASRMTDLMQSAMGA